MRPISTTLASIVIAGGLSAACGPQPTPIGTGGAGGTGSGGTGAIGGSATSCTGFSLPVPSDYGAQGPFAATVVNNTGPSGQYTLFRPTILGQNGFLHPPATWGNGITTTPSFYTAFLTTIASHGFVIIASNSSTVTSDLMTQGLDWLIQQNGMPGDFSGKLATSCAVSIGYSLGGGAAVGAGSHRAVKVVASMHGLQGAAELVNGPLLLTTSTNDGFVTKSGYVQPTYNRSSKVPTILATLEVPGAPADFTGHLIPLNDAGQERAPVIAWLRYWIYGDQGARGFFFGSDCTLCKTPWTDIQRKNYSWQ